MLFSSLGSLTPFAKNFQLVLFLLRVPALFGRIFKNATAKLMGPEFIISITLFLLTLKASSAPTLTSEQYQQLLTILQKDSSIFATVHMAGPL
ncbi:hypothetical protein V6Z11_D04G094500 [Gossypium hirsutum]